MKISEKKIRKIIKEECESLLIENCWDDNNTCAQPPASLVWERGGGHSNFHIPGIIKPSDLKTHDAKHAVKIFGNPSYDLRPEDHGRMLAGELNWDEWWLAGELLDHCVGWASCAVKPPETVYISPDSSDEFPTIPEHEPSWYYEEPEEVNQHGNPTGARAPVRERKSGLINMLTEQSTGEVDHRRVRITDPELGIYDDEEEGWKPEFEHWQDEMIFDLLTGGTRSGANYPEMNRNLVMAWEFAIRIGKKQREILEDEEKRYFKTYLCIRTAALGRYALEFLDDALFGPDEDDDVLDDALSVCYYHYKTTDPRGADSDRKRFISDSSIPGFKTTAPADAEPPPGDEEGAATEVPDVEYPPDYGWR